MAQLHSLIRLRKYRVEEKQKILAELFRQAELIEGRKRAISESLIREKIIAEESGQVDAYVFYAAYASRMTQELEKIEIQLQRMDARIEKAQEDLREAFAEQKKAEIIQKKRDKSEQDLLKAKENREMDNIGIDVFLRGQSNDKAVNQERDDETIKRE